MNDILFPAIYKHYKGMFYITLGIAHLYTKERIQAKIKQAKSVFVLDGLNTETKKHGNVFKIDGEYYAQIDLYGAEESVVYVNTFQPDKPYIRPTRVFKEKVNDVYRFKLHKILNKEAIK